MTFFSRPPARIRVMLVDDHAIVRSGYRRLLELEADMQVVSEHADADAAYAALLATDGAADVVVLDLSMPGRSGLDVLQRATQRWPQLKVLVFSMHDAPVMVRQALDAGAAGYVTKNAQPEELVDALRGVVQARPGLPPLLSADLQAAGLGQTGTPSQAPHERLSVREFDVLRGLLRGETTEAIATRLKLSTKTVANYQSSIRQQLGVSSAVELLRYGQAHGLDAA